MKWILEYDNDETANGDGFIEWWTVSDSVSQKSFTCYHKEDAEWLCNLLNQKSPSAEVKDQQGELLPEEKEVINEWRRARMCVRNGKFGVAEERIEQVKKIIGEATNYYNDKTEIPELL